MRVGIKKTEGKDDEQKVLWNNKENFNEIIRIEVEYVLNLWQL